MKQIRDIGLNLPIKKLRKTLNGVHRFLIKKPATTEDYEILKTTTGLLLFMGKKKFGYLLKLKQIHTLLFSMSLMIGKMGMVLAMKMEVSHLIIAISWIK